MGKERKKRHTTSINTTHKRGREGGAGFVLFCFVLLGCVYLLSSSALQYTVLSVQTTDSLTDDVSVFGEPLRYQSGRGYPGGVGGN